MNNIKRLKRRQQQYRILMQTLIILCFVIAISFILIINLFGKSEKDSSFTAAFSENSNEVSASTESGNEAGQPNGNGNAAGVSTENNNAASAFTENNQNNDFQDKNWSLILVNRDHPLPDNYTIDTVTLSNGQMVDARMYPYLQEMFDDMRAEGIYPEVVSGWRTYEKQQQLMEEKIQEYVTEGYSYDEAKTKAKEWVAIPGTSEHQLGLAVDINADGVNSYGYEVYDWLLENAWKYGFVKRYPEDKTEITGIINEPWHYRYVGYDAAKEMTEKGLCLEEYAADISEGP